MDCNSYSYAPYMLDCYEKKIDAYNNDDMEAELTACENVYSVYAISYDGSLDVMEEFAELETARQLYKYIVDNYSYTPPGRELDVYIKSLHNRTGE